MSIKLKNTVHELKIAPEYFQKILSKEKTLNSDIMTETIKLMIL